MPSQYGMPQMYLGFPRAPQMWVQQYPYGYQAWMADGATPFQGQHDERGAPAGYQSNGWQRQ